MTVELCWPGKNQAKALVAPAEGASGPLLLLSGNPVGDTLDADAHHVLAGDNLPALRLLAKRAPAFHFVYIDPPYNTGQMFTYRDAARRMGPDVDAQSAWLSMMYPRLGLAHACLRPEGVLFVSIDDRELASLNLILCEIFGRENFVGILKWRKKRKPSFLDRHLSSVMEYILVFAKDVRMLPRFRGAMSEEVTRPVLNAGNAECERVLCKGVEARCAVGTYPKGIYKNRTLSMELLDDLQIADGKIVADARVRGRFRVSQDVLDESVFITQQFGLRRHVRPDELSHKHVSDHSPDWPTNEDAEAELREIFGRRVFDFPKPVGLIQSLLRMCPVVGDESEPFRCLDFFAGSGTLAEAVFAQNAEDGRRRLAYCVQQEEPLPEHVRQDRLQTIADITRERVLHAARKYGEVRPVKFFEVR